PGCENLPTENERKSCSDKKLLEFIVENLSYPGEAKDIGLEGRVYLTYIIDTLGNIGHIEILRGNKIFNEEAIRVMSLLPAYSPAISQGEKVSVRYTLPINFALRSHKKRRKKARN